MSFIDVLDFFMSLKQWGKLLMLSILGATVQMYLSEKQFTFFHYLMNCLVSILCAYLIAALCKYAKVDPDLTTGLIAVAAYSAPHILSGINKLAQQLSQNPKETLLMLLKLKR